MITASGTAAMFVGHGTSSVHRRCDRDNPLVRRAGVDRILSRCGRGGRQGLVSFAGRVPNVRSRWFAVFGNRRRPTIGMPTHSQHPRRDRLRRHKGVDVSHPRCIMVSSRKHHRSVCGTDRTGAGIMLSEPTPPRGWRDAFGNRGGGGWGWARRRGPVRRFSRSRVRQGLPGGMAGTSRVSITNPGIRTPGGCRKTPRRPDSR